MPGAQSRSNLPNPLVDQPIYCGDVFSRLSAYSVICVVHTDGPSPRPQLSKRASLFSAVFGKEVGGRLFIVEVLHRQLLWQG